jgi:ATP-dependent DNA helicase RecQ
LEPFSESTVVRYVTQSILFFMAPEMDLLPPLRRYWGYDSFRPMQERIVRSLLGAHDCCVVMPTGGGKSLCYQLPALALGQTAVVISPLIALMQDQAAQLAQMGIPAAVLNSSFSGAEQSAVMRKAQAGEYRLLYLSPERLARADTVSWLQRTPIAYFAIDEAHCISEWGHEFRPEYRQLNTLRLHFPEKPIAAFTASATRRVRHDILHQLQLRNPDKYIASFHRPNLRYMVRECESSRAQASLLLRTLRYYSGKNVIVYSPTIAKVEETVDYLEDNGIPAIAYHGKMETSLRRQNQERWMSDEVRVLVGTIAFGLGINKASVRAVIHLSLPKSIEQYYQEAGRAGRDGDPADCILLWQKRDAGLLAHFIDQVSDAAERDRAWQRYHAIRAFAESKSCRHHQICMHFGETPKWTSCGACDVCGCESEWLVKVMDLEQPVAARPKVARVAGTPSPESAVDPELREYLREWRRAAAKEKSTPAFVVLHDTSLEEICRVQPKTIAELLSISGIGERKAELYGPELLKALQRYRTGARAHTSLEPRSRPAEETIKLLTEGRSFEEIAKIRGRQINSVVGMVAELIEKGDLIYQPGWVNAEHRPAIESACATLGLQWLKPLKEALPPDYTFEEIRLVVAHLRREQQQAKSA